MPSFLKFSKFIINTKHITCVLRESNAYQIQFSDHKIDGFLIFGGGGVSSDNRVLKICKDADPNDYAIIEKWVNEI